MSEPQDFLSRVMAGTALLDEIDDFIDMWHDGDSTKELHEFLGMRHDEYSLWLGNPDMLAVICTARRQRRPLVDAVNDNLPQLRMAARSGHATDLKRLEAGLRREGKIV